MMEAKIPITISQELIAIAQKQGIKINSDISLSFVEWLSNVMSTIGMLVDKSPTNYSRAALCVLVTLVRDSRFDDIREIINTYIDDISRQNKDKQSNQSKESTSQFK
jgi:hypothetical protein